MSQPVPWSVVTSRWTCQLCRHNNARNTSHCACGASHRRAALVRDRGTALGWKQLGPRSARPAPQPRRDTPWRANGSGGKGEGQRTAPQSKTDTTDLDGQIKCVRAQIKLGQDAGRDTAALQDELRQLEEKRALDKSDNAKLAEQLRSKPQTLKSIGSGLFCLRKRANWRSCRRRSQRRKQQSGSWSRQARRTFQWNKFWQVSFPRSTQVMSLRRRPGRIPNSGATARMSH